MPGGGRRLAGVLQPPALPTRLTDIVLFAVVGSALWFAASVALLVAHLVAARPLDDVFTTTVAGWLLGLIGLAIRAWQRAAGRRGSRGAQQGL